MTLLHTAAAQGSVEICSLLLARSLEARSAWETLRASSPALTPSEMLLERTQDPAGGSHSAKLSPAALAANPNLPDAASNSERAATTPPPSSAPSLVISFAPWAVACALVAANLPLGSWQVALVQAALLLCLALSLLCRHRAALGQLDPMADSSSSNSSSLIATWLTPVCTIFRSLSAVATCHGVLAVTSYPLACLLVIMPLLMVLRQRERCTPSSATGAQWADFALATYLMLLTVPSLWLALEPFTALGLARASLRIGLTTSMQAMLLPPCAPGSLLCWPHHALAALSIAHIAVLLRASGLHGPNVTYLSALVALEVLAAVYVGGVLGRQYRLHFGAVQLNSGRGFKAGKAQ